MPTRRIDIDGRTWQVFPSGYITQSDDDEFGLLFVHGAGDARELRVTRYSPTGARAREQSLADLSDTDVRALFEMSQSSVRSPEAGYSS